MNLKIFAFFLYLLKPARIFARRTVQFARRARHRGEPYRRESPNVPGAGFEPAWIMHPRALKALAYTISPPRLIGNWQSAIGNWILKIAINFIIIELPY